MEKITPIESTSTYTGLGTWKNVRVNVPAKGEHMKLVPANTFKSGNGDIISVKEHWRQGLPVGKGRTKVIININFFGFCEDDLGREHNSTVKVVEKKHKGVPYIMLDVFKKTDSVAKYTMSFSAQEPTDENSIYIRWALRFLDFIPIPIADGNINVAIGKSDTKPTAVVQPATAAKPATHTPRYKPRAPRKGGAIVRETQLSK
jgi:hypothetical protein